MEVSVERLIRAPTANDRKLRKISAGCLCPSPITHIFFLAVALPHLLSLSAPPMAGAGACLGPASNCNTPISYLVDKAGKFKLIK